MTKSNLAKRLKELRKKRNLDQTTVGRVLEISRSAVATFEDGTRDVSALELDLLCKLYATTPNDVLDFKAEVIDD